MEREPSPRRIGSWRCGTARSTSSEKLRMRYPVGGLAGTAGNGMGLNGGGKKESGTQTSFTRRWRQVKDTEKVGRV